MGGANVLGFDVGTRVIGVAIGNPLLGPARPLPTVAVGTQGPDWQCIDMIFAEWQPAAAVVGLPLAIDGGEQQMTKVARAFAKALAERSQVPVHHVDERHSSRDASDRFARQRAEGTARRKHAVAIDSLAAAVILDRWFDQQASGVLTEASR